MPPIQIQTSKPINTAPLKSPNTSQPPSQQSSRQPSPTRTTAAKPPVSPTTLSPHNVATGPSAAGVRYAPASPTSLSAPSYPLPSPGAPLGPTPTGTTLPPPPRSPTRTVNQDISRTGTTPPPPQPGAAPVPGASTAQSLLAAQPGYSSDAAPPQPGPAPSLSHPPGYHQNPLSSSQSHNGTASAANTSMGMGSLTPLSRSNTSSPLPPMASPSHKRNMSGAGLPDPGSEGLLNGYLPEGAAESAGQYWSAMKGWVGSTASSVGKKAAQVEDSVWKRVNGE